MMQINDYRKIVNLILNFIKESEGNSFRKNDIILYLSQRGYSVDFSTINKYIVSMVENGVLDTQEGNEFIYKIHY